MVDTYSAPPLQRTHMRSMLVANYAQSDNNDSSWPSSHNSVNNDASTSQFGKSIYDVTGRGNRFVVQNYPSSLNDISELGCSVKSQKRLAVRVPSDLMGNSLSTLEGKNPHTDNMPMMHIPMTREISDTTLARSRSRSQTSLTFSEEYDQFADTPYEDYSVPYNERGDTRDSMYTDSIPPLPTGKYNTVHSMNTASIPSLPNFSSHRFASLETFSTPSLPQSSKNLMKTECVNTLPTDKISERKLLEEVQEDDDEKSVSELDGYSDSENSVEEETMMQKIQQKLLMNTPPRRTSIIKPVVPRTSLLKKNSNYSIRKDQSPVLKDPERTVI
eukprot:UN22668